MKLRIAKKIRKSCIRSLLGKKTSRHSTWQVNAAMNRLRRWRSHDPNRMPAWLAIEIDLATHADDAPKWRVFFEEHFCAAK